MQVKRKKAVLKPKVTTRVYNLLNGKDTKVKVFTKNKQLHIYMVDDSIKAGIFRMATVQRRCQMGWSEMLNNQHHLDIMSVTPGVDVVLCILLCAAHDQLITPMQ